MNINFFVNGIASQYLTPQHACDMFASNSQSCSNRQSIHTIINSKAVSVCQVNNHWTFKTAVMSHHTKSHYKYIWVPQEHFKCTCVYKFLFVSYIVCYDFILYLLIYYLFYNYVWVLFHILLSFVYMHMLYDWCKIHINHTAFIDVWVAWPLNIIYTKNVTKQK